MPYVSAGASCADMMANGRALGDFGYRTTAGLNLTWRVGHNLTLDASFNPDLAQVEADQVVLNLTTYEIFLLEEDAIVIGLSSVRPRVVMVTILPLYITVHPLYWTNGLHSRKIKI